MLFILNLASWKYCSILNKKNYNIASLEFLQLFDTEVAVTLCEKLHNHRVWPQAWPSREETVNPVNVIITNMKFFPHLKSFLGQENELIIFKNAWLVERKVEYVTASFRLKIQHWISLDFSTCLIALWKMHWRPES